jgi:hypothetical protein
MRQCFKSSEDAPCQSFSIGKSIHIQGLSDYHFWGHGQAMSDIVNYCKSEDRRGSSAIARPKSTPDDIVLCLLSIDNNCMPFKSPLERCTEYNNCFEQGVVKNSGGYFGIVSMDGVTPHLIKTLVEYVSPKMLI